MARFDTRPLLDNLSGALTLVAMAGLTFASAATLAAPAAEPVLHQLPTVYVTAAKATVHQLPAVLVTAKRNPLG